MGQSRFWNWKDDDSTSALSRWIRSFLPNGVLHGFEASFVPGMDLILTHVATGMSYVAEDLTLKSAIGVVVTKQGVTVQEDADLSLPIGTNTSGDDRYDAIIIEHEYQQVVGGLQATYSVIQGTPGAGIPALTDPNKQTLIGVLLVPDGTTDMTDAGIGWALEPVTVLPADTNIMRTNLVQTSTKSKTFYHQKGLFATATIVGTTLTPAAGDARNFYKLANVGSTRLDINTIAETEGAGNVIYLVSDQKLRFKKVGSGGAFVGPKLEDIVTEPKELIILVNMSVQIPALGAPTWMVIGGSVSKTTENKVRGRFKENKSAALTDIDAAAATGQVILPTDGNMFRITNTGADPLNGLKSFAEADAAGDYATEAGGKITLINSGASPITVNVGSIVGTGFKPLYTFHGLPFTWEVGAALTLIEDVNDFKVIGYVSANLNIFQQYLDDNLDVSLTAPALDDVLYNNGTDWINTSFTNLINAYRIFSNALYVFTPKNILIADYDAINAVIRVNQTSSNFEVEIPKGVTITDVKTLANAAYAAGTRLTIKITAFVGGVGPSIAFLDGSGSTGFRGTTMDTLSVGSVIDLHKDLGGKWNVVSNCIYTSDLLNYLDVLTAAHEVSITALTTDKADKVIDTWHTIGAGGEPAYLTGWAAAGGGGACFMKNDVGIVHVIAFVAYSGGTTSSSTVFQLPVGYRPTSPITLVTPAKETTIFYTNHVARMGTNGILQVDGDGTYTVQSGQIFKIEFSFQM